MRSHALQRLRLLTTSLRIQAEVTSGMAPFGSALHQTTAYSQSSVPAGYGNPVRLNRQQHQHGRASPSVSPSLGATSNFAALRNSLNAAVLGFHSASSRCIHGHEGSPALKSSSGALVSTCCLDANATTKTMCRYVSWILSLVQKTGPAPLIRSRAHVGALHSCRKLASYHSQ